MCGFFGCISQTPISHRLNLFHKALSKMSHRGPDNSSTEIGSSWFFGHNRLSIIAPSLDSANQPIKSDKNILLFNGMLYNFKELSVLVRSSLNKKEQLSDTKTLFAFLEKFGVEETLNKVDGMFAFSWYDCHSEILYLCRDMFGEKPLYYSKTKNGFYFASEIKSLIEIDELSRVPNINRIDDYFYNAKINGPETIYKDIYEVQPGEVIVYRKHEHSISKYFHTVVENTFQGPHSCDEDHLEELLINAVTSRLESDVPLGILLSGGIDSSFILSKVFKGDSFENLDCFFADNKSGNASEFGRVQAQLKYLQLHHDSNVRVNLHKTIVDFDDYFDLLKTSTWHLDEPLTYYNSPLLYNLCSLAADNGKKVLLSGEGADELFFGYDRFVRGFTDLEAAESELDQIKILYFGGGMHSIDCVESLCGGAVAGPQNSYGWKWLEQNVGKWDKTQVLLMYSQKFRLQTLLQRQDRMGMANSLELRVPFLQRDLVSYVNSIRPEQKYNGDQFTKRLLKTVAENDVADEIRLAPKMGFPSDMQNWLHSPEFGAKIYKLVSDNNGFFSSYLNGAYALDLIDTHFSKKRNLSVLIWLIFAIEVWHRKCGEYYWCGKEGWL